MIRGFGELIRELGASWQNMGNTEAGRVDRIPPHSEPETPGDISRRGINNDSNYIP